jgi:hypothetical protein
MAAFLGHMSHEQSTFHFKFCASQFLDCRLHMSADCQTINGRKKASFPEFHNSLTVFFWFSTTSPPRTWTLERNPWTYDMDLYLDMGSSNLKTKVALYQDFYVRGIRVIRQGFCGWMFKNVLLAIRLIKKNSVFFKFRVGWLLYCVGDLKTLHFFSLHPQFTYIHMNQVGQSRLEKHYRKFYKSGILCIRREQ